METETYSSEETYNLFDYLRGKANGFLISEEALKSILYDRGVPFDSVVLELDKKTKDLLTADVLYTCAMNPSGEGTVTDADGNWKHSEGGSTMSEEDKNRLLNIARAIYEKYDDDAMIVSRTKFTMVGFGLSSIKKTPFSYGKTTRRYR